jgi:hypothetical protein
MRMFTAPKKGMEFVMAQRWCWRMIEGSRRLNRRLVRAVQWQLAHTESAHVQATHPSRSSHLQASKASIPDGRRVDHRSVAISVMYGPVPAVNDLEMQRFVPTTCKSPSVAKMISDPRRQRPSRYEVWGNLLTVKRASACPGTHVERNRVTAPLPVGLVSRQTEIR